MLRVVLAVGLLVGVAVTAHHRGYQEAKREFAVSAGKVDAAREALTPVIVAAEAVAQVEIRTVTRTIVEKVPVYVKADACPLPGGFRLLHNAAASNAQVPNTASELDEATVAAAEATATVTTNYGICHENAARLTGLQAWVEAQRGLN